MATRSEMLRDWLNGTPTGGPNGDGRYPLMDQNGEIHLVPCPAAQALDPNWDPSELEIFTGTATEAATKAAESAEAAAFSESNARGSASAAATSAGQAAQSATAAEGSASAAATSASEANSSKNAAASSASSASTSASTASSAKTAAEAARNKAQEWAEKDEDIPVETGKFSARHWALKAAASAAALGNLAWSAISGKPSVLAGNGLTGGGLLDTNKTLTLGTPSDITGSTANTVTTSSHTHKISNITTASNGRTVFHNEAGYSSADLPSVWLYPPGDSSGTGIGLVFGSSPRVKWDTSGTMTTGTVPWDRLSEIPTTASRWPAWEEITSKPMIVAGSGLTGGGSLAADQTISLGTPGTLSGVSTNAVTTDGHTHALSANLKAWDGVKPSDYWSKSEALRYVGNPVDFDAITQPLAWGLSGTTGANRPEGYSAAVTLFDSGTYAIQLGASYSGSNNYYIRSKHDTGGGYKGWVSLWHSLNFKPSDYTPTIRSVSAGNGLSGGGDLTANRTISLGTPSTLSGTTTNSVSQTSHTHALSANLKAWDGYTPVGALVDKGDLGANRDLNDIQETGLYRQNLSANAGNGANYPLSAAGVLEVIQTGSMTYQRYTVYNSGIIYTRSRYTTTWYPWRRQWDDTLLPNPVDEASLDIYDGKSTVVKRTGSADIYARLFRSTYASQATIPASASMAFRNNDGSDNYIRFVSDGASVKSWIGLSNLSRLGVGQLDIQTNYGSVSIGPANASYCHMNTDLPYFYMNRGLQVNGEIMHYRGPRVPKMFIQSGDPGTSAETGDLWIW